MRELDKELYNLKMDVLQKHYLEARMESLIAQKAELEEKSVQLEQSMRKEQADVDKLEQNSLSRLWQIVINNLDETLEREQAEAYEASLKYDMAQKELQTIANELLKSGELLEALKDCELHYETVLSEKQARVQAENPSYGAEILRLEALIGEQENYIRELDEGISAGVYALEAADSVLAELDEARSIGMIDVFFSGGLFTAIAKHNRLEQAQYHMETLQSRLRSFKTELADVQMDETMQMELDGLTYFADWFFDGIIMDSIVLNEISKRQDKLNDIKNQINAILNNLEERKEQTYVWIQDLLAKRNEMVLDY